jgi:hypothetical protein
MSITWSKAIRHVDRAVKPTQLRRMRSMLLKADVKRRRNKPSGSLPSELVFAKLRLRIQSKTGQDVDTLALARIDAWQRRYRLNERKRERRLGARRRARPSVKKTKINLWRRRQQWLQAATASARLGNAIQTVEATKIELDQPPFRLA